MFALVDGNNFFASCQRVFRPDLMNKPVVVLSNNDGNIIARSKEVKALGVPMAAPYYQVKSFLQRHNVTVFSSNFPLYGDLSQRMMRIIESIAPHIEIYSIDEAFIDFTQEKDYLETAKLIQNNINQYLSIPTSIGIAPTKTLAKVANKLAKSNPFLKNICLLIQENDIDEALKTLSVSDIWGIGYRLSKRLHQLGIHTAYQLKDADPKWIRSIFSVVEERIVYELRGISCLPFDESPSSRKSIQVTRSFGIPITDLETLKSMISGYACQLGTKLRQYDLKTQHILVYIKTNPFQPHKAQHKAFETISFPIAINDNKNLITAVSHTLEKMFKQGMAYHKGGVMAYDLCNYTQLDLLTPKDVLEQNTKQTTLSRIMDHINHQHGRGTIYAGICMPNKGGFNDKKQQKSPCYTTKWCDIPIVTA